MELLKLYETPAEPALLGLALSHDIAQPEHPLTAVVDALRAKAMLPVAERLAPLGNGHNKFLEFIVTYWLFRAPLTWWKQFDTYRHAMQGVDPSGCQRASTMHTLLARPLTQADFARPIDKGYLKKLNAAIAQRDKDTVVYGLPDGYLQLGCVKMNYQVLRNILTQRDAHKLDEWRQMNKAIRQQVDHPEWLPQNEAQA